VTATTLLREKRLRLSGVRIRESRLTIALTALKLADCQGRLFKSRNTLAQKITGRGS
jgi:hypothetical protein